jgi:hypothetical protein
MGVGITDHAVERYRERVHPELTFAEARRRLIDLARKAERVAEPPWGRTGNAVAWLLVEFGVALPLVARKGGSRLAAATCLVNPAFRVVRR